MSRIAINKNSLLDFALRQIDNLGYELQRRGISSQVNRHNLAALAMTKQQQFKGELTRYELHVGLQRARLEKARQQALNTMDQVIERMPAPIAQQLNRAKSYVL
ncbi:MAG: hypothetical protein R3208_21850 [Ketobacteraceae bacterium]|nr:hypothetical protein [Ketobacteraceae bacterium]